MESSALSVRASLQRAIGDSLRPSERAWALSDLRARVLHDNQDLGRP